MRLAPLLRAAGALVPVALSTPSALDPCGLVPPARIALETPIERKGVQRTYVFWKDGIESFTIRPEFTGRADEFGMLIPFPSPPAIHKAPDEIFDQIAMAVDPPEVVERVRGTPAVYGTGGVTGGSFPPLAELTYDHVEVLNEEAVGMYDVAVLEAGSAGALARWMDEHGYRYPAGMDAVCQEYVDDGWCFVAVKARLAAMPAVAPRPGMRSVEAALPEGATFDGAVQAMSFRFRSPRLEVPMRLSTFNGGDLHNVVYVLTERPCRIRGLGWDFVRRQVSGAELLRNLTGPRPLRIVDGKLREVSELVRESLRERLDPIPVNGLARDLFAGDLLAARTGRLEHPFEDRLARLVAVSERLGMRGAVLDELYAEALARERDRAALEVLGDLEGMTLTVLDGDFERRVLERANLLFEGWEIPAGLNRPERYHAPTGGPQRRSGGGARYADGAGQYGERQPGEILARWGPPVAEETLEPPYTELFDAAGSDRDVVLRGEAITELVALGGDPALFALGSLRSSWTEIDLVRAWAAGGELALASSWARIDEVLQGVGRVEPFESLLRRRLAKTSRSELVARAIPALIAAGGDEENTPAIAELLGSVDAATWMDVLYSPESPLDPWKAASWLGAAARGREGEVTLALAGAWSFDSPRRIPPLEDGPLGFPSIAWPWRETRELVHQLVGWLLWCEAQDHEQAAQGISGVLRWRTPLALRSGLPGKTRWTGTGLLLAWSETAGVERALDIASHPVVGSPELVDLVLEHSTELER